MTSVDFQKPKSNLSGEKRKKVMLFIEVLKHEVIEKHQHGVQASEQI